MNASANEQMDTTRPSVDPAPPRKKRAFRRIAMAVVTVLVLFCLLEAFCRLWLGLGDPPLSMADPEIEYLFQPSKTYSRFGNHIAFNEYSMRSGSFPRQKTDPNEFRLMMIGDSIINGGALTDQANLATEILQRDLPGRLGRPVIVGNISAGSWGPANMLAYVRKFGLFDADAVVIVLNFADYGDVPAESSIVGVSSSFPDRSPLLASFEAFGRYLWPRIRRSMQSASEQPASTKTPDAEQRSLQSLEELIAECRRQVKDVAVLYYPVPEELDGRVHPGTAEFREAARSMNVPWLEITEPMRRQRESTASPYRAGGDVHPSDSGQQILADTIIEYLQSDPTR